MFENITIEGKSPLKVRLLNLDFQIITGDYNYALAA